MSLVENIRKRSVDLILDEIKEKGFVRVAEPENVYNKVKEYTGIELEICDYMLRFKKDKLF